MSRIYNFCLFVASRSHNQNKSTEEHRMSLGAGEDKVAVSDSVSVTTHKAHSHSHSVSLRLSLALSHTLYLILLDLCVAYYIWGALTMWLATRRNWNCQRLRADSAWLGSGSRTGRACRSAERACVPRKSTGTTQWTDELSSTFDQLPVADKRVRAYSTFEYFELSSSQLCWLTASRAADLG